MPSEEFTGIGWRSWTTPNNVNFVQIELLGAGNENSKGGRVLGQVDVSPNEVLWIFLGESGNSATGEDNGAGSSGGGGPGGQGFGRRGGDGGAGATYIRRGSKTGTLLAVAGGAGGRAGSGARGGHGGDGQGESGKEDFASAIVVPPTGGSQSSPGARGKNLSNSNFDGVRGQDAKLGTGGRGGSHNNGDSYGGGGGGGGYYPGSGGTASGAGGPSTGGSGGSNYTARMTNAFGFRGEGKLGNGSATLTWTVLSQIEERPNTPSEVTINGDPEAPEFPTNTKTGPVVIEAKVTDPNANDVLQLSAHISVNQNMFPAMVFVSSPVTSGERARVTLNGLAPNTHYYGRLYGYDVDAKGLALSLGYNSIDFWTNRPPNEPELVTPSENATVSSDLVNFPIFFDWKHSDPDDPEDDPTGWEWRIRRSATATTPASAWLSSPSVSGTTGSSFTLTAAHGTLSDGINYDWAVRTKDSQGVLGPWSLPRSFYVLGATNPPVLSFPIKGEGISTEEDNLFQWRFTDPTPAQTQINADLRYRLVGQSEDDWIMLLGQEVGSPPGNSTDANGNPTNGIPGNNGFWTIPAFTLDAGYLFEWQVRTTDSNRDQSGWSPSALFWTTPLTQTVDTPLTGVAQGSLGCGEYRVFAYQQGGNVLVGEITPLVRVSWNRRRDDISNCTIFTNGFDYDCGQMLGSLHCWLHELVVYRDGKRVWEGPITRIGYSVGSVEIEAQDVIAYLYRRIMRQGYDDSHREVNGVQFGLTTVVERARRIVMNALAPSDPNVLPYLTAITLSGDARQSRVIPDYAKTAWEEIDDLAATAGLDYTAVGRRILLWDVHRPIGRLPELRDKDFSDPPIVTEYGMQLANYYAVTNNTGTWGAVTQPEGFEPYGPIEMLASAYGETATQNGSLTRDGHEQLVQTLEQQASRGFADRWPTPVVVRVPDNAQMSPEAPVTLDQLVPGTWLPVFASGTVRHLAQWQKLDAVNIEVGSTGEQVRVTMSPAPNAGEDPDNANALAPS